MSESRTNLVLQPLQDIRLQVNQLTELFVLTYYVAPESEGSLPQSQQPTTDPYPEPTEFTSRLQPVFPTYNLIPLCHPRLDRPSCPFPSRFTTKTLYTFLSSFMRATCPVNLIFLDWMCLMIFGEEYNL